MQTVFTRGVLIRRGQNTKGTDDTVSNGSIIHVYDNQFMMLVDGGKIVDYTAEPGYYKVDNSSLPSLFNGQLKDTLKDSFARIKFGGQTPESNSEQEIQSTILIISTMQNCSCVHTELIPLRL